MSTEQSYPCQKCGQMFQVSKLMDHYYQCKGPQPQVQQQSPMQYPQAYWPQQPQQAPQSQQQFQVPQGYVLTPQVAPILTPPPHQHQWIENKEYKWCVDPTCKALRLHIRGWWFLFVRYGLKLFWIQMLISLAIAFSIFSAYHPR